MAAMLVYRAADAPYWGSVHRTAGFVLGGSIQEVAHAVAAGYSVDANAGNVATLTKLMRVAMLAPMLFLCGAIAARSSGRSSLPLPPWFLVAVCRPSHCSTCSASFPQSVGNIVGRRLALLPGRWRWLPSGSCCRGAASFSYGWQPLALLVFCCRCSCSRLMAGFRLVLMPFA